MRTLEEILEAAQKTIEAPVREKMGQYIKDLSPVLRTAFNMNHENSGKKADFGGDMRQRIERGVARDLSEEAEYISRIKKFDKPNGGSAILLTQSGKLVSAAVDIEQNELYVVMTRDFQPDPEDLDTLTDVIEDMETLLETQLERNRIASKKAGMALKTVPMSEPEKAMLAERIQKWQDFEVAAGGVMYRDDFEAMIKATCNQPLAQERAPVKARNAVFGHN